ncbi:uncharacterized protein LOC129223878 [Uloborus diversus]|uniref:uncharacterized protein LOC129223878 n=1 Tax=Uloborus diversus TaxID=327109 RepID=UPI002409C4C7|nr:uncharacterized protein LOC129223878 [Uloborus diversus]
MTLKFLLLLFCAISCTTATTDCTKEEYKNCYDGDTPSWFIEKFPKDNKEELEKFCLKALPDLDCAIAFSERCPDFLGEPGSFALKLFKKLYAKECDKLHKS